LYNKLIAHTGLVGDRTSRVIKKGFTEIKKADAPSFLIENGYMDSPDVQIILSENHADKTAHAIVDFLISDFKLTKKKSETGKQNKVQCGCFSNKSNAAALLSKLKSDGYDGFIVEV